MLAPHLHRLSAATGTRTRTRVHRALAAEHADRALLELLTAMRDVPGIILGRRSDVLAWNPLGHALLAPHLDKASALIPGRRPNMVSVI